ncbi:MAG: prepilin peptidase [Chloroflexi bacterium]|nr:prepilin peptidase [Chloroflexota bacterium]
MWETDIFVVLFCLLILIYACWSDIRTRSVSNIPWLIMAIVGVVLLVPRVATTGTALLIQTAIATAITLGITYLFFRLSLFGPADAKCLIAMSLLFPIYPSFAIFSQRFPLISLAETQLLPFALATLMNATLLAMFVPLSLGLRNLFSLGFAGLARHPGTAFTGYQVPIAQLGTKKNIRLIHQFQEKDGELRRTSIFGGVEINDELVNRLESYHKDGKLGDKVWVMPELPFVVFITLGFVTTALVGNLALALLIRR